MRTPVALTVFMVLVLGLVVGSHDPARAATAPSAPQQVFADATAANQVTVSWAAPVDDGQAGAASVTYMIARTTSDASAPVPAPVSTTALSTIFNGLQAGTTFTFSVTATTDVGTSAAGEYALAASDTPMSQVGSVSISGTPRYRQTLTAVPAGWSASTTFGYQWTYPGGAAAGTGATFPISDPSMVGRQITVSMVARAPGFIDAPAQTVSSDTVAPAPMPTGFVYIGGTPVAGHTWQALTRGFAASRILSYQWYLDGKKLNGHTAQALSVPNAWKNVHRVSVRVMVRAPGYAAVLLYTHPLRVQGFNPIAGDLWPSDVSDGGNWDADLISAYHHATGTNRTLLGKIATRPRVTWFGAWMSPAAAADQVKNYIASEQAGDSRALVQMAMFTIYSVSCGEGPDCRGTLTSAQVDAYTAWYRAVAKAIGTSRVAIVMEPDLALLDQNDPAFRNPSQREKLVAWATHLLAANPNAAIYLDAGDSDWVPTSRMASILKASGVAYARGFALGATHYSGVGPNVSHGAAVSQQLAHLGIAANHRHFVIDTADNGRPFTWAEYHRAYGFNPDTFDNAFTCAQKSSPCDTLGTPPTWQIADTKVQLTSTQRSQALDWVDGYLWFGRPWLINQASPYNNRRALDVARTSPYA